MLQKCPFCGNNTVSDHSMQSIRVRCETVKEGPYGLEIEPFERFYVQCGRCYARTGGVHAGYNSLVGRTITAEQAAQMAVEKWNRRA